MIDIRTLYTLSEENPFFSASYPNNFVLVAEDESVTPMIISEKQDNIISGYKLRLVDDLYSYPYPSRNLLIGIYKKSKTFLRDVTIINKCVVFLQDDCFVVFPFVNPHVMY